MTGKEFATLRKHLGYTQADIAQELQVSTPTVCRLEEKAEVPGEHVKVLLNLPPAAGAARGPYRKEKPASSRKPTTPPPPRRAQAPAAQQLLEKPLPPPAHAQEGVHEADTIGAVDVGAVWLAACLLLGIYRHIEKRAVEEEVEATFARIHVRSPVSRKALPPPMPKRGRVRCCWRCGTWL